MVIATLGSAVADTAAVPDIHHIPPAVAGSECKPDTAAELAVDAGRMRLVIVHIVLDFAVAVGMIAVGRTGLAAHQDVRIAAVEHLIPVEVDTGCSCSVDHFRKLRRPVLHAVPAVLDTDCTYLLVWRRMRWVCRADCEVGAWRIVPELDSDLYAALHGHAAGRELDSFHLVARSHPALSLGMEADRTSVVRCRCMYHSGFLNASSRTDFHLYLACGHPESYSRCHLVNHPGPRCYVDSMSAHSVLRTTMSRVTSRRGTIVPCLRNQMTAFVRYLSHDRYCHQGTAVQAHQNRIALSLSSAFHPGMS